MSFFVLGRYKKKIYDLAKKYQEDADNIDEVSSSFSLYKLIGTTFCSLMIDPVSN